MQLLCVHCHHFVITIIKLCPCINAKTHGHRCQSLLTLSPLSLLSSPNSSKWPPSLPKLMGIITIPFLKTSWCLHHFYFFAITKAKLSQTSLPKLVGTIARAGWCLCLVCWSAPITKASPCLYWHYHCPTLWSNKDVTLLSIDLSLPIFMKHFLVHDHYSCPTLPNPTNNYVAPKLWALQLHPKIRCAWFFLIPAGSGYFKRPQRAIGIHERTGKDLTVLKWIFDFLQKEIWSQDCV